VVHSKKRVSEAQYKEFDFITTGIAPGFLIEGGIFSPLSRRFRLSFSIAGRVGLVWRFSYPEKDRVVKESGELMWHNFTGIYLNVGINYYIRRKRFT